MKVKVKFKNKSVNVKKLVQGAVVFQSYDGEPVSVFHIHKFTCLNTLAGESSADIVVVDDWGKWNKNTTELIWPI